MYQNIRRERNYTMQQTIPRQGTPSSPNRGRSQSIIITAITLFALSGLLVGFAFGALTIKRTPQVTDTQTNKSSNPVVIPQALTPTATPTQQIIPLGYPKIDTLSSATQVADGTTTYTLSAYPVDQSIDKGHGKQVHADGITCKIWLTKNQDVTPMLLQQKDRLQKVETLTQPMPDEVQNAFTFTTGEQTQKCSATGSTTWSYTIAPSVDAGNYLLVILTDWSGQRWNWFATQIQVTAKN
jgi:hypothetical protein